MRVLRCCVVPRFKKAIQITSSSLHSFIRRFQCMGLRLLTTAEECSIPCTLVPTQAVSVCNETESGITNLTPDMPFADADWRGKK